MALQVQPRWQLPTIWKTIRSSTVTNMKNSFVIYLTRMAAGLGTFAVCTVLGCTFFYTEKYMMAVAFLLIALVFLVVGLDYGSVITIEAEGIRKSLFGKTLRFMPWSEVKEVGVTGTKVFGATEKQTGTLFIYISAQELSEEDHFRMMLEWPPKEQLFLEYEKERIDVIQLYWASKIETYQTGKLTFS